MGPGLGSIYMYYFILGDQLPEKLLWKQIDVITANIELFQKVNHRNKVQTKTIFRQSGSYFFLMYIFFP